MKFSSLAFRSIPDNYLNTQKIKKGQKLVLPPVIFAIMKGPAGLGQREATKVLETFKNRNQKHQQVLLIIETHKEYWSKCNYGGVYKEDNSHDDFIQKLYQK